MEYVHVEHRVNKYTLFEKVLSCKHGCFVQC